VRTVKPWHLITALILLCGGIVSGVFWWRTRPNLTVQDQLRYVPPGNGPLLFVNTGALRRSGLLGALTAGRAMEEREYRDFVQGTGFDYREDLDSVLLAWREDSLFILATGHFQWERIARYAVEAGGHCLRTLCWVRATAPDHFVSITPLRTGVIGLAVSTDREAAFGVTQRSPAPRFDIPSEPVWALFTRDWLVPSASTPEGLAAFLRSLDGVNRATVSLGGTMLQLQLNLRGECPDEKTAARVAALLAANTDMLRRLLAQQKHAPNDADLSGVLTAGVFEAKDGHVLGRWPISREFVEALVGGDVR